jgi:hypothetical protein
MRSTVGIFRSNAKAATTPEIHAVSIRVFLAPGKPLHDGHTGRGAKARGAGFDHRQRRLCVANAAGGFHAKLRADGFPHQLHVVHRRAAGAQAGGGFDKFRTALGHQMAGEDFLLARQQAGFEDDLRPSARCGQ